MNIDALEITHKPTKAHLYQIYKWLKEELNLNNSFFYNFILIKKQLKNGNGICLLNDKDEAIGFIIYLKHYLYAEIQIANIKHNYKNKGLGSKMFYYLEKELIKEGIMVLQLFCAPISSKPIWLKIGFTEFNDKEISSELNSTVYLYKIIVESLLPKVDADITHHSYLKLNKKIWQFEKLEFEKPIIYNIGANNNIKSVINNEVVYYGTVKKYKNYYTGNYLIIKSLDNDTHNSSNNSTIDKLSN